MSTHILPCCSTFFQDVLVMPCWYEWKLHSFFIYYVDGKI